MFANTITFDGTGDSATLLYDTGLSKWYFIGGQCYGEHNIYNMKNELNDDNFLIFAIKHYRNPSCTGMAELEDDLKRFKYLKRLFNQI